MTSKLREVHSCTAHDIVQLGVYTELNISNVGKLQFLDDKEIKIKFVCWLPAIRSGGEAQLHTGDGPLARSALDALQAGFTFLRDTRLTAAKA